MKKYVWSETTVDGGGSAPLALPAPPRTSGGFQGAKTGKSAVEAYGEAAVFAYPAPPLETAPAAPQWTTQAGPATPTETIPGAPAEGLSLKLAPAPGETEAWLEAHFPTAVTLGAISLSVQFGARVAIEAETAPGVFKAVGEGVVEAISGPLAHGAPQQTIAFAPVRTQRLRLRFAAPPEDFQPPVAKVMGRPKQVSFAISRLALHTGARIDGFEAKAGFSPSVEAAQQPSTVPADALIDPAKVVDLTGKLRPDGTLDWTPPKGRWTIVRLGWSLTGAVNAPAEPSATGLEVDKLDAAAVGRYLDHYLDLYQQASGDALGPKGVQTLLTDSWEAGVQNWTPAMLAQFRPGGAMIPPRGCRS